MATTSAAVTPASSEGVAESRAVLGSILLPGINIAIWRRILPSAVSRWLVLLRTDTVDDLDFVCDVSDAARQLGGAFATAGYPDDGPARWLRQDIGGLVADYAGIMDIARVALRLEVIETDACRRFHADYVTARGIVTYRGPGTRWLPADAIDEAGFETLGTGHFAMMKGRLWAPDAPLVHRSPPIEGTGVSRLTLTLDPPGAIGRADR